MAYVEPHPYNPTGISELELSSTGTLSQSQRDKYQSNQLELVEAKELKSFPRFPSVSITVLALSWPLLGRLQAIRSPPHQVSCAPRLATRPKSAQNCSARY